VIFFEGTLMRSHQPALNERRDTVCPRQNLIGLLAGAFDERSLVDVIIFSGTGCWVLNLLTGPPLFEV
jgi:hypothetical protein